MLDISWGWPSISYISREITHWFIISSLRNETGNFDKFVWNLNNKQKYIVYVKNLKRALNHGLVMSKVDRATDLVKKHD